MRIRRCNHCLYIGTVKDFANKKFVKNYGSLTICPVCNGCSTTVMNWECGFSERNLQELWRIFGDVAVDDRDRILEAFLGYSKGTDKLEVWKWFDDRYPEGVVKLIQDTSDLRTRAEV